MLSLSQTTGYAILALSCLSETAGGLVLAKDIAACTGIPLPYLSKILHAMRRTGLILGKRGYRGGFALARPPGEVSLLEVAEAVEGDWLPQCLLGWADCAPERSCPTHAFWTAERARIEKELRHTTLADVALHIKSRGMTLAAACCTGNPLSDRAPPVSMGNHSAKTGRSSVVRRKRKRARI